jgi:hypothetical protein
METDKPLTAADGAEFHATIEEMPEGIWRASGVVRLDALYVCKADITAGAPKRRNPDSSEAVVCPTVRRSGQVELARWRPRLRSVPIRADGEINSAI